MIIMFIFVWVRYLQASHPPPPAPSGGFISYSSTDSSCRSDCYRASDCYHGETLIYNYTFCE